MGIKLSHSSCRMYTECPRKFKYWYVDRLRPKVIHGALLYGSAIDHSLNHLLETKNLEEAKNIFDKAFRFQPINNEPTYLPETDKIVYSYRDFDAELLTEEDYYEYDKVKEKLTGESPKTTLLSDFNYLQNMKKEKGLDAFSYVEKVLYNLANWLCLRRKGHVMLQSYTKKVLPKIKQVLAIQKRSTLTNEEGDEVTYILDLAVEWEDGKRYLLDNKTSAMEYDKDSAMKSQQLVLYYHAEKEELKLDAVGFIVMYKTIMKNRVKICKKCNNDGSGTRFKTCNNILSDESRCNGEWDEKINPECDIDIILNPVPSAIESLVIETFDEANNGIKKQTFGPNLNACGNDSFKCVYYEKCYYGKDEGLIKLDDTKNR